MTLTFDTRARMFLLVTLLVLAGAVAAFMAYQRLHDSSGGSSATPAPSAQTQVTRPPATHASATKSAAAHKAAAKQAAVTPRHAPTAAKPKPVAPPDQLPLPIRRALARDRVVVVALYDPNAKIDGSALAEARAGALLAGSSFVKVDVTTNAVESLNAKYGAVQDPAVIVLRPPGALVVRIDGFADRDTVAQAALNAAS